MPVGGREGEREGACTFKGVVQQFSITLKLGFNIKIKNNSSVFISSVDKDHGTHNSHNATDWRWL